LTSEEGIYPGNDSCELLDMTVPSTPFAGGGGGPRIGGLDARMVQDWDQINKDLINRMTPKCEKLLSGLINQLKASDLLSSDFTLDTLRSNITNVADITLVPVYDAKGSPIRYATSYGEVTPGTNHIYLQDSVYLRDHSYQHTIGGFTGDLYSTLLHEGFHLVSTSANSVSLTDTQIYDAIRKTGLEYANKFTESESIGGTFAKYCGPNQRN
jgi:hypothetical protein